MSRPRKRILVYDGSELTQSILRVVLESKGRYRVETEMSYPAPDVFLLVGFSKAEYAAFEAQRGEACRWSTVVSVPKRGTHPEGLWIGELLDRLYRASFRQRGPKPKETERKLAA